MRTRITWLFVAIAALAACGERQERELIDAADRVFLVVLDRNLFEIPASEISEAQVTMTVFDGQTVFEQSN